MLSSINSIPVQILFLFTFKLTYIKRKSNPCRLVHQHSNLDFLIPLKTSCEKCRWSRDLRQYGIFKSQTRFLLPVWVLPHVLWNVFPKTVIKDDNGRFLSSHLSKLAGSQPSYLNYIMVATSAVSEELPTANSSAIE